MPQEDTVTGSESEPVQQTDTDSTTPDDLEGLRRALQSERGLRKQAEALARQREAAEQRLAEIEDAQKSEAQRLTERAEAAERDLADLRVRQLRMEVAAGAGLPATFADRLTGSTREELAADAATLLAELRARTSTPPAAAGVGVTGTPADGKADLNDLLRRIAGH